MSFNVFMFNDLTRFRSNADVFQNIQADDKLRWESDKTGSYIAKIDKAGMFQGVKRSWACWVKDDVESQGIEASLKAIEFAESFWQLYCYAETDFVIIYQFVVFDDKKNKTEFPFDAIGSAFVTLSQTYDTANSRWRKDSDEEVQANYEKAAEILGQVVEKANEYNIKLSRSSPPIKIPDNPDRRERREAAEVASLSPQSPQFFMSSEEED
ncbi:MAG: hypothetical protein K1000chlam1_01532 [Candidatus Anoxychlamydiales bacterium]|nr:hypothetical protein [Candidatus Anoxychlamydiales bacterium]